MSSELMFGYISWTTQCLNIAAVGSPEGVFFPQKFV